MEESQRKSVLNQGIVFLIQLLFHSFGGSTSTNLEETATTFTPVKTLYRASGIPGTRTQKALGKTSNASTDYALEGGGVQTKSNLRKWGLHRGSNLCKCGSSEDISDL